MAKVKRKVAAAQKGRSAASGKTITFRVLVIAGLILLLAMGVRAYGIMDAGITWDEPIYVKTAIVYAQQIPAHSIFDSNIWIVNFEHPPVAKLIYAVALTACNTLSYKLSDVSAIVTAKYTSALLGALTCVLVYFLGREVYDGRTGVVAGVILALLPVTVAHSQIAGLDSPLALFFTASVLLLVLAMKRGDSRLYAASAVAAGLTVDTKLNGLLIIPLLGLMYGYHFYSEKKSIAPQKLATSALAFLGIVTATIILFWPWLWTGVSLQDPLSHLSMTLTHWDASPMEYFLGTSQAAPIYYLPVYFLVTTPLLVLVLGLVGVYFSAKGRDPYKISMLFWLVIPFAYCLYSFVQDGVRYIYEIYPAVALVAAFGLTAGTAWLCKAWPKVGDEKRAVAVAGVLLSAYLIVSLALVSPYYLDYYNVLSGGQSNAENNRLFNVGWWGEGTKACVDYVEKNAAPGSTVLLATMPSDEDHFGFFGKSMTYLTFKPEGVKVFDFGNRQKYMLDNTTANQTYAWNTDYVIMNVEFVNSGSSRLAVPSYTAVYSATVNGAPLCTVYKKN